MNGVPVATNAKYFPLGEVQKRTWGNGQAYERIYDLDGRNALVEVANHGAFSWIQEHASAVGLNVFDVPT